MGCVVVVAARGAPGADEEGAKSEAFCRETLPALQQNPQIVPARLNLGEALADLRALDQLRPRLARLQRLTECRRATRACPVRRALGEFP